MQTHPRLLSSRFLGRCVTLFAIVACFGLEPFAQAQVGGIGQVRASPFDDDEIEDEPSARRGQLRDRRRELRHVAVRRWTRRRCGPFPGSNRSSRSRSIGLTSSAPRPTHRRRRSALSDSQKKKLTLAGRGDIKRFFDKVAEKKRKFDLLKNDQQRIGEIFQEIQPLQNTFNAGIFGDGSFYSKTVKNTLNQEQAERYAKVLRDRDLFRYRARVVTWWSRCSTTPSVSAPQGAKEFVKLLLDETTPPKHFGQYDTQVVLLQAAKLPEGKIKPIFDDAQWRILSRQLNQAKGMEVFLKQNGFLDDDKPQPNNKPADVLFDKHAH